MAAPTNAASVKKILAVHTWHQADIRPLLVNELNPARNL